MEPGNLCGDPPGFLFRGVSQMADDGRGSGTHGMEFLVYAVFIVADQRIGRAEDFRGRAVIVGHHDGLCPGKLPVKVEQVSHIGAAPGINGLVGIAYDKQIFVIAAEHLHQLILETVDVLKFIDHDIFQPLLPFQPDILMFPKDVQGEFDEVIVIQTEAFLFLIQVAIENDILRHAGPFIFSFSASSGRAIISAV